MKTALKHWPVEFGRLSPHIEDVHHWVWFTHMSYVTSLVFYCPLQFSFSSICALRVRYCHYFVGFLSVVMTFFSFKNFVSLHTLLYYCNEYSIDGFFLSYFVKYPFISSLVYFYSSAWYNLVSFLSWPIDIVLKLAKQLSGPNAKRGPK